jgi:AcrR family transcriptional regulator
MPSKPRPKKAKARPPERVWKLPRGRGGLPPEIVDEIQRERVFAALLPLLAERGYGQTSVSQILRDAGMSSRTFWELFGSKEDCLLAAYRIFSARLGAELQSAWDAQRSWPEQIRAALSAALDFAADEPEVARLLLVEVQAAGDAARAARHQSLLLLAAKLDEGRAQSAGRRRPQPAHFRGPHRRPPRHARQPPARRRR